MPTKSKKPYKGLPLEGVVARWYAKNTARDVAEYRKLAHRLADQVVPGAAVLEVAPGPGYLAIELAKRGDYRVTGLDVSKTFVRMAAENAARAGVPVTFREGDAANMPLDAESFDLILCRAAFKNFSEPVRALNEMYRVLRPGGKALIIDLRKDASVEAVNSYVNGMGLGFVNSLLTKWIFKYMLIPRAYSQEQFREMATQTPFSKCEIRGDLIGLEVTLVK